MGGDHDRGGLLILGVGNSLLTDDGAGLHVLAALAAENLPEGAVLRDGGTIGLALLPEIEAVPAMIAIDACELHAPAGTVRVFEGTAMDRMLSGTKRTAHEVALADLLDAARLTGALPERRALVGIQPQETHWGLAPSPAVARGVTEATAIVLGLAHRWSTTDA